MRIEREEVTIRGDERVGASAHRRGENLIVFRIVCNNGWHIGQSHLFGNREDATDAIVILAVHDCPFEKGLIFTAESAADHRTQCSVENLLHDAPGRGVFVMCSVDQHVRIQNDSFHIGVAYRLSGFLQRFVYTTRAMRSGAAIEVQDLCVDYPAAQPIFRLKRGNNVSWVPKRRYRALHEVSFTITPGERVGIVGMNGAGKSTLFRTLAGILSPADGSAEVGGYPVTSPYRLPAGYMAASPLLYRRLTGYENLRYVASLYHVPNADDRIFLLAERVGIADRLSEYVEQYSRGMMARLDLARTLLPSPPLLLLDEPFTSLDVRFVAEAQDIIRETHATVLLATHNLADIEELTHRILLLHEGRLLRDVSFEDLSEVAPSTAGKALSITEFVDILLRRSLAADASGKASLHRKYVVPT